MQRRDNPSLTAITPQHIIRALPSKSCDDMIRTVKEYFLRRNDSERNMIGRMAALAPVAVASITLLTLPAARAEGFKLPPTMAFTAYDTGTAGFNISVAVGKMMKDKYSTDVRVLPAGNDVARLAPVRAGRAMVSAMGSGSFFAQEGVFEFGAREWGPQPLQLILSSTDCNGQSLGVARDTGITEIKQLQGKRVGFVVGSPALNQNALAVLAFAGLTQKDVKIVEFASYGAIRLRHDDYRACARTGKLAARHHLAATSAQGRGRLGPRPESRRVLHQTGSNLRRRDLARKAGRNGHLPLSEFRHLRFEIE
jgi:hypothetical protein